MFLSVVANKCFYFREDVEKAKSSGDWKTVYDFYLTTFDSFPELSACFRFGCFLFPQCVLAVGPLDMGCAGAAALAHSQDSMGAPSTCLQVS